MMRQLPMIDSSQTLPRCASVKYVNENHGVQGRLLYMYCTTTMIHACDWYEALLGHGKRVHAVVHAR